MKQNDTPARTSGLSEPLHAVPLAVLLALLLGFAFQGSRGLYESTEGRYAECARETLMSGDLDDPILNGQPHWTKPPLTYMAIMAGMSLFGENPWGVRAYLVVAWTATVAALGWAGTILWGKRAGGLAALITATCPFVAGAASSVSTDMLVVAWAALTLAAFFHAWLYKSRTALMLAHVCLGLGVLTKGPVALLVPLPVMVAAWPSLHRTMPWHPSWRTTVVCVLLFLITGVAWYVIEASHHDNLAAYWIGKELIARNVSNEFARNAGFHNVLIMYIPILLFGTGPWLPMVLWGSRSRTPDDKATDAQPVQRIASRSLMVGIALPFVLFSVSRSKLPLYMTPLFVPMGLLLGHRLDRLIAQRRVRWKGVYACAASMALLILGAKAGIAWPELPPDMTRLAARVAPIVAEEPSTDLFYVGGRTLNGLEFHLHRGIESVQRTEINDHVIAHGSDHKPSLYLVRRKDWEKIRDSVHGQQSITPVGPHWLLLRFGGNSSSFPVEGRHDG